MRRPFARPAVLLAVSFDLMMPAFAAQPPTARPSVLESAAALDQPVTYAETKIPLGELVQKVAADTGVSLAAAREVSDEPVAVVVKEMPARRLLEQIASLLDYQWTRDGHEGAWRYVIEQDLASKQREAALRQAQMEAVQKRLQERLASYGQLAALPEDRFQAVLDEAQKHEQELQRLSPEQRQALLSSPEERAREQRCQDALQLWTPANRAMARLISALTARQWSTLRDDEWLNFCTDPQPGEGRLPLDAEKALRARQPGSPPSTRPISDTSMAEEMRKGDDRAREQWAGASGYRVTVRLDADRFPAGGGLWLTANAFPLRSGQPMDPSPWDSDGWRRVFLYAGPEDLPQEQARTAERTPERQAVLEKDPVIGLAKRFQPSVKPRPKPFGSGSFPLRFRDLLPDLARTYGVQILSDAYWTSSPRVDGPLPAEPVALFRLLDDLAGATHRWDHDGGGAERGAGPRVIRLRSRTWFFDRPHEVPLRLVRHWQRVAAVKGLLPFEEYVEMATGLTKPQWDTLDQVIEQIELPFGALQICGPSARDALRFYASLAPGQQQTLWASQVIALSSMTDPQKELFMTGLREEIRRWYQPIPVDLSHLKEGGFAITQARMLRTIVNEGGSVSLQRIDSPTGSPSGPFPGFQTPEEFGKPVKSPPARVDQVTFQFEYRPGLIKSVDLTIAPRS